VNRVFLEGDKLKVAVKNGRWVCSRTCPPSSGSEAAPTLFSGLLKRRRSGSDTVTETALHVVTPLPWPIELGEHVGV
jgi:hypothetical protein